MKEKVFAASSGGAGWKRVLGVPIRVRGAGDAGRTASLCGLDRLEARRWRLHAAPVMGRMKPWRIEFGKTEDGPEKMVGRN
jgi:hypothetical protein